MTRYLILAALALVTPARRGPSHIEGRLARAEYGLRHGTRALFLALALVACACGRPSRATRTALDELHALDAQCQASAAAAAEEATSYADGQARLDAAREGCITRAHAYCDAHRLDCSEILP